MCLTRPALVATLVAALMAPLVTAPAQAGESDAASIGALMALLAQRRHGIADFQQTQYLSVLKGPQRSTGILRYEAPDHLEQRTLTPRPQSAVLDHGVLTLSSGTRERTLRLEDEPQLAPLIDSVRSTLAGDLAALERDFSLQLTGDLAHWELELTPREPSLAALLDRIRLLGERDLIEQVQVQQRNGDRTLMIIQPRD
jgi:hypothetical protein